MGGKGRVGGRARNHLMASDHYNIDRHEFHQRMIFYTREKLLREGLKKIVEHAGAELCQSSA